MKLQFQHQSFQTDAARAVVDVFAGQPRQTSAGLSGQVDRDLTIWRNAPIVPALTDPVVLAQLHRVQQANQIPLSPRLEGHYNLTIEMETGVGKTYTYIKTIHELYRNYGWSKYIVVVPSVAIREGVRNTFQATQAHFAEEYGRKIRFFLYNSARLSELDRFASDSSIQVMIINAQAFNARGQESRRIYLQLDTLDSRRPMDLIAQTNPILIIDEPQSVEGRQTRQRLREFHPLFTLRYSATHRPDSVYNMVYRLDALDAYRKRLVKQIAVKGISQRGAAGSGYVYLENIHLSKAAPTATLQFDRLGTDGVRRVTHRVDVGFDLFAHSGTGAKLEAYRNGFVVKSIDGRDNALEFLNGIRLHAGDAAGNVSEAQLRRIQIRETILSHIERERQLFSMGIKVLSLFFIDEVAHYRQYDAAGRPRSGIFADMFEAEYRDIVSSLHLEESEAAYGRYLKAIPVEHTHAGYFSVDRQGRMTDGRLRGRREKHSDDQAAYELILNDKERLLELDPGRSPVRFLFSHSALREGWDNPNVFQICTLKQSGSEVRKRQEVGRGLRLCVNQKGMRMDAHVLGDDVHRVNVLTVIASESYDSFARGLQAEMADALSNRPRAVTAELFRGRVIRDAGGQARTVDAALARAICQDLAAAGYVDRSGALTDAFFADRARGRVSITGAAAGCAGAVLELLDSVYCGRALRPENARSVHVELHIDPDKLSMPEFQALWSAISRKSVYTVSFDSRELIQQAIASLNRNLRVPQTCFQVEAGTLGNPAASLQRGVGLSRQRSVTYSQDGAASPAGAVQYDLVGRLAEGTGLTRRAVAAVLTGLVPSVFCQFRENPEAFIVRAAALLNSEKAAAIVQHISYQALDDRYGLDVLTGPAYRSRPGGNAVRAEKHLFDFVLCDSAQEQDFVEALERSPQVAVYVKLPQSFCIPTPVGRCTPAWAIAFRRGTAKHACLVADIRKAPQSAQLHSIEAAKLHCAKAHFQAVSGGDVACDAAESGQALLEKLLN